MGGLAYFSRTAAENANADPDVNWTEKQLASTINGSARAEMASVAKWRDDNLGLLVAKLGVGSIYSLATYQGLADVSNAFSVRFTPDQVNAGTCFLNVDGRGARPLHRTPGVALEPGDLKVGTPYTATYLPDTSEFIIPELRYTGLFRYSAPARTGWERLPSGLLMQFGSVTTLLDTTGAGSVLFPTLFPTAVLSLVICNGDRTLASGKTFDLGTPALDSFTFGVLPNPGAVTVRVNFTAFGV